MTHEYILKDERMGLWACTCRAYGLANDPRAGWEAHVRYAEKKDE